MKLKVILPLLTLVLCSSVWSPLASAGRWQVRQEIREGAREVAREKQEAKRALMRCKTRQCARREIREGYREVSREKREARYEIRRELREARRDRWDDNNNILGGVIVGAAIIGVASAIANDDD